MYVADALPPAVVNTRATEPTADTGVNIVTCVAELDCKVACLSFTVTDAPSKFVPFIVTSVEPVVSPVFGVIDEMVGCVT